MQYRQIDLGLRPSGGPASWLAALLGIIGLTVAMVLGIFFFTLFLGIVLVAGLILAARVWWIRRRILRHGPGAECERRPNSRSQSCPTGQRATLEGEFTVLDGGDGQADQRGRK